MGRPRDASYKLLDFLGSINKSSKGDLALSVINNVSKRDVKKVFHINLDYACFERNEPDRMESVSVMASCLSGVVHGKMLHHPFPNTPKNEGLALRATEKMENALMRVAEID